MVFYQMDTEEVSDRFVAPCFVNGLEAYDGGINLGVKENMISNEYAVKLCLEHEVKRENKVVKTKLIVALRGEIYFVKFIINPEEDNVEPGVDGSGDWNSPKFQDTANRWKLYDGEINLGVKGNMNSKEYAVKLCLEHEVKRGNKVVKKELIVALRGEIYFVKFIINPEEDDVEPRCWVKKIFPPFVCKMGKSSRNKKRAMENLNFFYQDIGTSSSAGGHLTQEEA
ncbi:hypothetical protein Tco_1325436 [Tanacetum coccineum]